MSLERMFNLMAEKQASDLFLGWIANHDQDQWRMRADQPGSPRAAIVSLLAERLTDAHFRELEDSRELNIGLPVQGIGSFRLSAFLQRGSISAVIRSIPHDVPKLDALHLPEVLKDLIMERRGMILVVGAAGSGKSTTIRRCSIIETSWTTGHVLTFEDPIEYLFRNKKSIINQRESAPTPARCEQRCAARCGRLPTSFSLARFVTATR